MTKSGDEERRSPLTRHATNPTQQTNDRRDPEMRHNERVVHRSRRAAAAPRGAASCVSPDVLLPPSLPPLRSPSSGAPVCPPRRARGAPATVALSALWSSSALHAFRGTSYDSSSASAARHRIILIILLLRSRDLGVVDRYTRPLHPIVTPDRCIPHPPPPQISRPRRRRAARARRGRPRAGSAAPSRAPRPSPTRGDDDDDSSGQQWCGASRSIDRSIDRPIDRSRR